MPQQQIGKHWGEYLRDAVRYWLGLADDDISNVRGQLERIVDCVCERHGVSRHTAELEIYKGLLRLTAGTSCAASRVRSEKTNL
jgi:hypothetical protein